MKIALYSLHGGTEPMALQVYSWRDDDKDYVRLSEIVDIEFPMLASETVVPQQMAALAAMENELRDKFNEKLSQINVRRANLQALTHEIAP